MSPDLQIDVLKLTPPITICTWKIIDQRESISVLQPRITRTDHSNKRMHMSATCFPHSGDNVDIGDLLVTENVAPRDLWLW